MFCVNVAVHDFFIGMAFRVQCPFRKDDAWDIPLEFFAERFREPTMTSPHLLCSSHYRHNHLRSSFSFASGPTAPEWTAGIGL
jgi:hypothetical protein